MADNKDTKVESTFVREDNLADLLRYNVRTYPNKVGFFYLDREINATEFTYSQFYSDCKKVMTGLQAVGVGPGSKVCFQLGEFADSILVCWACWQLGAIILPLPVPDSYNTASAKLAKLEAACSVCDEGKIIVVTASQFVSAISNLRSNPIEGQTFPTQMTVLAVETLLQNEEAKDTYKPKAGDMAAFMLTSGSTGNPKAVMLSHANILQSHYDKLIPHGFTDSIRTLNWIACDHVACICDGNILPMAAGGTQGHIKAQHVIEDPLRFLRAIHKYRVTQTVAPNFLFSLIVDKINKSSAHLEKLDLSCLDVIMSGGEAVVVETAVECIRLLKLHYGLRDNVIKPGFGMTEICAGSVWNHKFPNANDKENKFAGLGQAMPGLQMRVVDDEGKEVKSGVKGNLQFKGVACFRGYYKNKDATDTCFPNGLDDWFLTGDLATLDAKFGLRLAGRTKDIIIINGQNFESDECEREIQKIDGVEKSFCAATPVRLPEMESEEYAIFFSSDRALTDDGFLYKTYMRIRDACVSFVGIRPYAIICLPKNRIPKSTLGKIFRRKLRASFEKGEFKAEENLIKELIQRAAGDMVLPETKTEERVLVHWCEVLGMEAADISTKINFFDIGGTSLDTISIKARLDQEFGFEIPAVWVFSYPTIQEFSKKVSDKLLIRDQLFNEDGSYNHELANSIYDPIVRFHDTGDKKPLFAVHTGAGDVLAYVELAKRFQYDRPFYGIRTRGFDEGETRFDQFYGMVDSYCQGVLKTQPEGPYYIVGYSYGAVVAYEMAKVLEQKYKKEVAFCGSIDTPVELRGFGEIPALDMHVYLTVYLGLVEKSRYRALLAAVRACEDKKDWVPTLMAASIPSKLEDLKIDAAIFETVLQVAWAFKDMALQQKTEGRVQNMQVFSCFRGEPMMVPSPEWRRQQRMWANHAHNIQFYNIRGHHETAINPENIVAFHNVFKSALDVADVQSAERAIFKQLGGVPVDEREERAEDREEKLFNHDEATIASMRKELSLKQMSDNLFEV